MKEVFFRKRRRSPSNGSDALKPYLDIFTEQERREIENIMNDPCNMNHDPEAWLMMLKHLTGDKTTESLEEFFEKHFSNREHYHIEKVHIGDNYINCEKRRKGFWWFIFTLLIAILSSGLIPLIIEWLTKG